MITVNLSVFYKVEFGRFATLSVGDGFSNLHNVVRDPLILYDFSHSDDGGAYGGVRMPNWPRDTHPLSWNYPD